MAKDRTMEILVILTILLFSVCCQDTPASPADQEVFTDLTGEYLGQNPPGKIPELFAPGIVSVDADFEHSAAVFSPDGTELFWCSRKNLYSDLPGDETQRLYQMKMIDGRWTAPRIAPFTQGINQPVLRPVFSPDGNSLYLEYSSDPNVERDNDIYVFERQGEEWSGPEPVSPLINSPAMERLHSVTANGSMYFTRDLMTPNEGVFISRQEDGVFAEPEELGESFNSDSREYVILMAPDETFMLISQSPDGRTDELYVSYQQSDGSWTERIKTEYPSGGFLSLSPDWEYLFFLGDEGIYWVDMSFVEALRPAGI